MKQFYKQLIFILLAVAVIASGALAIYSATPSGFIKIKPSLTAKVKMVNQENATSSSNNPVGWWKMDEGTGQYAYDVSGNGNTGTLGTSTVADGADPTWATGKLGKGLSFDGVNDYVDAGNGASLNITNSITISGWVKPNVVNIWQRMATRGAWSTGWIVGITNTGKADITAKPTGASVTMYGLTTMQAGQWYHIVGVIDSSTQKISIYLNGKLDNTPLAFVGSIANPNVSNRIGIETDGLYRFNGIIDDVRIYNRALSAGEVGQMYNSTKDGYLGKIKMSTGLVGYWKLDDNNALTSVIDYSGKGNTGTAYSGTATSTSVLSTSTAMIGRAMSFDGVDDYVDAGNGASINSAISAITFSAWIKPNNVNLSNYILFKCRLSCGGGGYSVGRWNINVNGGTFAMVAYFSPGGLFSLGSSAGTIVNNNWQYVSATFDGSIMRIYINGLLVNTSNIGNQTFVSDDNLSVFIGGGKTNQTNYFNGLIDDVKIWNYARSAEQIKNDYIRNSKGLK